MELGSKNTPRLIGLLIAATILGVDLWSKYFFQDWIFDPPQQITVTSFFNFTPVWNYGVSFGMFPAGDPVQFYALITATMGLTAVVAFWLWQSRDIIGAVACGMVLGGGIGNIYDRIQFGAVRDFFHLYYRDFHWPVFNVADSAIVCGVLLLLFSMARIGSTNKSV